MRAPLSWIREYVDLPADVSVDELTWKLTMLGLKLEAVHTAGAAITGPLVVGRVLTIDKEPQKNGKIISWCTVDVGDANGTGEPQGIVCGAHNFAEGDLVVVVPAGRGAARELRDQRPQDLRPRLGRHDLLGARARPRRGRRGHHRAPAADAGQAR